MTREKKNAVFWNWCKNTLGGPHNSTVSIYDNQNYFELSTAHSKRSLENKLNHILENVSEIIMTCLQLRFLLSKLPSNVAGCRDECTISCFSLIIDPENFECQVLSLLTTRERDTIIHRLGCLNVWTPIWMDRQYILNLAMNDQRKLAEHLIVLGKQEDGDRHHFFQAFFSIGSQGKPMERAGFNFHGDSQFTNGKCPDIGIFSFRYGVQKQGPTLSVRTNYMSNCYSGRCMKRITKYECEISSAIKIQAYIRRTIGRLRYVRANWCIAMVDFATPKARNSATLIQGLFRGYELRKMLRKGTLDTDGTEELVDVLHSHSENDKKRAALSRYISPKEKRRRKSCFMLNITGVESLNPNSGGMLKMRAEGT